MEPLVVKEFIKTIIDEKIKNLNPLTEEIIIEKVLKTGLKSKYKIISFIRKELELPKTGSDKKIYWIKRGWSDEEIKNKRIIKKMPSSPMKIENWINKLNEKTGKLYTEEEANIKIKSFRKLNKEYWIDKGFSIEESIKKVKEYQKENSDKFVKKILENPENYTDRTTSQLNYWIKKGYTEEESKAKVSNRQDNTSINYLLSKYDEELAKEIYEKNSIRKRYEMSKEFFIDKGYTEEESIQKMKNRKCPICKASKESLNLIKPIYNYCIELNINDSDIYFGLDDRKEFFLLSDKNIFFYDLVIRNLNIIIEYHGIKYHPNPNWDDNIKISWKSLYSNFNYTEKYNFDKYKEKIAMENGFDIYVFYSDESLDLFLNGIKKIIKEKLNG